jgi:phosphohistidine phosphatase
MRELWLMRHGAAEGAAPGGDAMRRLTDDGERTSRRVARALGRMGVAPDEIWHSPFVRATQTARAVAEELGADTLVEQEAFTPHGYGPDAAERLFSSSARRLLLISHLPLLPATVCELLAADVRLDYSTSSVAHLLVMGGQGARGSCALASFFRSDALAALAE